MEQLNLFIGGESIAQIRGNDFFILKNYDDMGLTKTDLQGFKTFIKQYETVCMNSWNEELKQNYIAICKKIGLL